MDNHHDQRGETKKREMFMGAMLLASAINRSIPPGISGYFSIFLGGIFQHWSWAPCG